MLQTAPARQGLTLAVVLLAVFVVPTSISGTAVALPAIGADLHAGSASLQWVVNAFNLAFACCTLVWGSLADRIGRIRAFTTGAAIFTAASVACAVTPNVYVLDAARAVAGIGGAALFACGSAIISTAFDGAARAKAFALFGTVAGIGVALGPTVSGPAVDGLGWRWIFGLHAVALALVLLCLPAVARTVEEPRGTDAPRLDLRGAAVFVLAMLALTYAIVQGSQWGWTAPGTLGLLALALVLLAVFTAHSRRTAAPLLDLSVLRNKAFLAYCLVPVAASFGFVTQLTYLPTYLTTVAGHSPSAAGATMLLLTLPVLALPLAGAQLVQRGTSATAVVLASLGFLVVGDLALLLLGPDTSTLGMAVPMLLTGAGMGLSAGLVDAQALALVDPAKAGMAAGFLNTLRLGSEAVAVAVFGSAVAGLAAGRQGTGTYPAAYDSAFHTLLWAMAAVCAALAAAVVTLARREPRA
ncbi:MULTISPECIES: MFS transporter [unclassified Streptomyces]|uniref:MFS transporter n=1 Tax=unclassified Streptomyces TaxID=2593676 RepID=UPI000364843B|nr:MULTISPECIES: MFS transporter [unclassified Streptomyces]MYQ78441.1 MFS transporter [Streptomyces sp. SID4923]